MLRDYAKKTWVKVLILMFAVLLLAAIGYSIKSTSTGKVTQTLAPAVSITYQNLEQVLSSSDIIRDLPEKAVLMLKFYNFNSGERQWEKSYVITRGSVKEGAQAADVTFFLHSKYLGQINTHNFCSVIVRARQAGDAGFETSLSQAGLAWKYKSMLKYRQCLGF